MTVCAKHTKCPSDYIAWHEWAEKKARTHEQILCPDCELLAIWVPKKRAAGTGTEETT